MSMKHTVSRALLALAVSAGCGGALAATPALPPDLPGYAADKPLPVPDIQKKTLGNGLEVWVVPRDGIPRVDYVLAVRDAGLAADAAATPGFASLLAGLLTEGTQRRDSRAIAEAAQGLGGSIAAAASNDGINVAADALASHAAPMLSLLAEVVRTPAFPDSEVRLAQANAAQGLKVAEAQPGFRASRALLAAIYGDHPYARTQLAEATIPALTPEALKAEHARRFHPDHALLVIAGRIAPAQAFALAEQAFGDWRAGGAESQDPPPAPREATPQRAIIQRDGSVQSTFRIGRPAIAASDADYLPLQLASTVLGSGISSRLNQNLREDKGYTYGAGATLQAARVGGGIVAQADVRNEVTGAALREFFREFSRLGSEPVPAAELDSTKRYVAGGYLISNQMQGSVAASLARNWLVGLPAEFLGQYVPRVRAVSAEQVQAAAGRYYDSAQLSVIVVGDGKAVSAQLKPFGEFESRER
ncbi:pitrilysin family protein [Stenotrophomonas sp. MMGLT7]|uniref:M16 family metallopeptidase n=1 Tax=Stenotrophomonas sp. MMGLT7 TaxID=2901227 RepID=UPI001E515B8F|nr:pitrilysin family protein [Stenotrophomonas sp. MMGLT7]MCD7099376.1 insulinase family protein [Stenotrophomonas sp. MMGLT7]